jgi:uncharacterized protein YjbI with pentapeptide repeats
MKRTLTALTVAATMFASSASAFDPDDLQKLKDTRSCWQCDLSDIVGYAHLSIPNLKGAMLAGADLSNANLKDVDLGGATLNNADLTSANMEGANLFMANLSDTDLSSANLKGADLNYANLKGVILCNTIMPDGSVIYSGC